MSERGIYGVFEGGDGTGKSLQAIRITDRLEKIGRSPLRVFNDETGKLEPIQEPGGSNKANELRRKIKDRSIERTPWQNVVWFTEARKSNWQELIQPALEAGRDVMTARSYISTIAYQGYGEGIPIQDIIDYTREEVGDEYMRPDFVAVLALKDEIERQRRLSNAVRTITSEADTFESMPAEFQASMQNGYLLHAADSDIQVIDADGTPDFVEGYLWAQINPLVEKRAL